MKIQSKPMVLVGALASAACGIWWALAGEPLWSCLIAMSFGLLFAAAGVNWRPEPEPIGENDPEIDAAIAARTQELVEQAERI